MDTESLKAFLTEEEAEELFRRESLEPMRRLLREQPDRFRLRAAPETFPLVNPRRALYPIIRFSLSLII